MNNANNHRRHAISLRPFSTMFIFSVELCGNLLPPNISVTFILWNDFEIWFSDKRLVPRILFSNFIASAASNKHDATLSVVFYDVPNSKVHGANIRPIWGRQDPGGPHVGPMNFAITGGSFSNITYQERLSMHNMILQLRSAMCTNIVIDLSVCNYCYEKICKCIYQVCIYQYSGSLIGNESIA